MACDGIAGSKISTLGPNSGFAPFAARVGRDVVTLSRASRSCCAFNDKDDKEENSRVQEENRTNLSFMRSEEHTSELQSRLHLVCRLLLEKKKKNTTCHGRLHVHPTVAHRPATLITDENAILIFHMIRQLHRSSVQYVTLLRQVDGHICIIRPISVGAEYS